MGMAMKYLFKSVNVEKPDPHHECNPESLYLTYVRVMQH